MYGYFEGIESASQKFESLIWQEVRGTYYVRGHPCDSYAFSLTSDGSELSVQLRENLFRGSEGTPMVIDIAFIVEEQEELECRLQDAAEAQPSERRQTSVRGANENASTVRHFRFKNMRKNCRAAIRNAVRCQCESVLKAAQHLGEVDEQQKVST